MPPRPSHVARMVGSSRRRPRVASGLLSAPRIQPHPRAPLHPVILHDALPGADIGVYRRRLPTLTVLTAPRCVPHLNVAAPRAETAFLPGTDAAGCARGGGAGCLLVVAIVCSSRWLFGRADVRGSTAVVVLFLGYVSLCPAARADCFLLCVSLVVEDT